MSDKSTFHAKILLFGEYGLIRNSMGLAIPYSRYCGNLESSSGKDQEFSIHEDPELSALYRYLKSLEDKGESSLNMNLAELSFELGDGLFFDSTIPRGMGLGSSGALTAALFDRFGNIRREDAADDILNLKKTFSIIESYFHGSSSGIDPLISYINEPILIKDDGDVGIVSIPSHESDKKGAIFLLNTTLSRRTEPLVNIFLEKCKNRTFSSLCDEVLLPITNGCVNSFLEGEFDSLYEYFRELSYFQLRHFTPMIPKLYLDIWKYGLESEKFYLKLCGAGGGGYILGITKNYKLLSEELSENRIIPVFNF